MFMLDGVTFDLNCPNCGQVVMVSLGDIGLTITCEHCLADFEFEADSLTDAIEDA